MTTAITLQMPPRFDDTGAFSFLPKLNEVRNAPRVVLDFSSVKFVYPFATLAIGVAIREFIDYRRHHGCITEAAGTGGGGAISYLDYFGFFRLLQFRSDRRVDAPGGSQYLPITKISREAMGQDAKGRFQPAVDKESDRLSKIICGIDEAGAIMISYCFREIIRNAFEHGEVSSCLAMAQRWDDGNAEIAIADRGIGIPASIRKVYPADSAHEAIRLAMRPGISSAIEKARGDDWDNSGFGLYVISELGRTYGELCLASGGALIKVAPDGETVDTAPLGGTIVKLRLNTEDAEFWPNILRRIVDKGEAEAVAIPGAIRTASKKSREPN